MNKIIGRTVGDQQKHVAIATAQSKTGDTFLLAASLSGRTEYVTWAYTYDSGEVRTFWGHYFTHTEGMSATALSRALADLEKRAER